MQGQLTSRRCEPAPPHRIVLLVARALVGARIRQSASATQVALLAHQRVGKSSLINTIFDFLFITVPVSGVLLLGFPLLSLCSHHISTPSSPTPAPPIRTNHRNRHRAFRTGLELICQLDFTRRCWEVDHDLPLLFIQNHQIPSRERGINGSSFYLTLRRCLQYSGVQTLSWLPRLPAWIRS